MLTAADNSKCVVLVPAAHHIESACDQGLRILESRGYEVRRVIGCAAIDVGRSLMASQALRDGFEELMWIDADVEFDPDDIDRLRATDLPLVCGIYPKRGERALPAQPVDGENEFHFGETGGLREIRYAAGGFTLVQRDVYETIREKLQLPECNRAWGSREDIFVPYYLPLIQKDAQRGPWYLTEDFAFCERARQCGQRVMADTSIRLWHIGKYRYGWEDAGREVQRHASYRFLAVDGASNVPYLPSKQSTVDDKGSKRWSTIAGKGSAVAEGRPVDHNAHNNSGGLFFLSGLPRSGSTLLLNLLGQNPLHHVTPTSGLIELFVTVKNRWPDFIEFKAEGLEKVKPRVLGSLRGILRGHFEEELRQGKTVFDKSRGWLQYIEPLEEALGRPVKVIVTVRDVRAIVASFEKIYRRRSIEYREALGDSFYNCQTIEGRAAEVLNVKSVVGLAIARLRDALTRGVGDRLVIIPYRALTSQPQPTLDGLHSVLRLPTFDYDPDHVEQLTHEDDHVHGMSLHKIRSQVQPRADAPWQGVLPERLCEQLAAEYADINQLATWTPATGHPAKFPKRPNVPKTVTQTNGSHTGGQPADDDLFEGACRPR